MRNILIFILIISPTRIFAQELTNDDFRSVIPFLETEDFKGAFERSKELIDKIPTDTSDIRAQVSYMNIYAAAGMVTLDQMTHEEFEKNVKQFIGKKLKMPGHPCIDSTAKVAWGAFQFKKEKGELQGFTLTGNRLRVNILLFEYYKLNGNFRPEDFVGKNVRCGGILESFEVNPNKSRIWIGRLHISNAYVRGFIPRK